MRWDVFSDKRVTSQRIKPTQIAQLFVFDFKQMVNRKLVKMGERHALKKVYLLERGLFYKRISVYH